MSHFTRNNMLGFVKSLLRSIFCWIKFQLLLSIQDNDFQQNVWVIEICQNGTIYDCNEMKYKVLSIIEYKTNMGKGRNFRYTKNITNELIDENWIYPSLDSTDYIKTISICSP